MEVINPGEDNRPEKKKKAVNRKLPRAQELPWPENLMREIGLELVFPDTGVYRELSDDQMVGLLYVTGMLKEKEQTVIRLRYEDHRSLQETADSLGLSRERIRQIAAKAVRKMRIPSRLVYYRDGYRGALDNRKRIAEAVKANPEKCAALLKETRISECGLSARSENCLIRAGLATLDQAAAAAEKDPESLLRIRNLGRCSLLEDIEKLEEYGVDTYKARQVCGFGIEKKEDIAELGLSVRLYKLLLRAGLDTVEKVTKAIKDDPHRFLKMRELGAKSCEELFEKLEENGVDCSEIRNLTDTPN